MWNKPLAYRMRPENISQVIGQQHLLGEGKLIHNMIRAKNVQSMILFGKSGIGKTSIALAIANTLNIPIEIFNASTGAKKELQTICTRAEKSEESILLFVDEIHRMNKNIQDYLLPFLENGLIVLIGATTENPYFSVNPAIRSRTDIQELLPLKSEDVVQGLNQALSDNNRGYGFYDIECSDEILYAIARLSTGDLRVAYNTLERMIFAKNDGVSKIVLTEQDLPSGQTTMLGSEEDLYNLLSAFQKSLRGSDVNASLYYLALLLESGELEYVCRRLQIIVFEDVGVANPNLPLLVRTSCETALSIGLPEARIPLANAVVQIALSEKSNLAYKSLDKALDDVRSGRVYTPPKDIMDNHYRGAENLQRGKNYLYPMDYPDNIVKQQYLPDELKNREYFVQSSKNRNEKVMTDRYKQLKKQLEA